MRNNSHAEIAASGHSLSDPPIIPCPSEVLVPFSTISEAEIFVERKTKPRPDSYDSSPECSLAHLLELYRLVEAEEHEMDGYVFDDSCLRVA